MSDLLNTKRAAKALGVSVRCLQWWDDTGLLTAARERGQGGMARRYSPAALQLGRVIVRLRSCGLSLFAVRRAVRQLGSLSVTGAAADLRGMLLRGMQPTAKIWVLFSAKGDLYGMFTDEAALIAELRGCAVGLHLVEL